MLNVKINLGDMVPDSREASQAAARGIHRLVVRHLRARNMSRPARENGMGHSNYWSIAADATRVEGNVVTVSKEGAALHYYGGTVLPRAGKKALAIPKHPKVSDQNPKEFDPSRTLMRLVWKKGKKAGTLRDAKTGDILYLLVPKAKIHADPTVLPDDDKMIDAARAAISDMVECRG